MNIRSSSVGVRRRDDFKLPFSSTSDERLDVLLEYADFFKKWRTSKGTGLTNETFLAVENMCCVMRLIVIHHFESLESESKIKLVSLLKDSNVSVNSIVESEVVSDVTSVPPFELCDLPETEITESELQVIFYVGGYCAHNLRKRISCSSCKSLLISDSNLPSVDEPTRFFEILNRGGLKCPANEIFLLCCKAYDVFCRIKCSSKFEHFLRLKSPRDTFVSTVVNCVEENDTFVKACSLNYDMIPTWRKVLSTFFNCLAELSQILFLFRQRCRHLAKSA